MKRLMLAIAVIASGAAGFVCLGAWGVNSRVVACRSEGALIGAELCNAESIHEAQRQFWGEATVDLYWMGDRAGASRYFSRLRERYSNVAEDLTLDEYVHGLARKIMEEGCSHTRHQFFVESMIVHACTLLAIGQVAMARAEMAQAGVMWEYYREDRVRQYLRPPTTALPAFDELRRDVVERVLGGKEQTFPADLMDSLRGALERAL
jgi:hypothetical protein